MGYLADWLSNRRAMLAWLVLVLIMATYLHAMVRSDPRGRFAEYYDDTQHVVSAQALARGEGYALPNVIGKPTPKYPIIYPWLLSWVWWWNPDLAPNTGWAFVVNAIFGCLYLGATFVNLRSWRSVGSGLALAACAFCAFCSRSPGSFVRLSRFDGLWAGMSQIMNL